STTFREVKKAPASLLGCVETRGSGDPGPLFLWAQARLALRPEAPTRLIEAVFLRGLLYSGQYLFLQDQRYCCRKQYEGLRIRAGYSNTARISFIATDDQCGSIHLGLHCAAAPCWRELCKFARDKTGNVPLWSRLVPYLGGTKRSGPYRGPDLSR